MTEEALKRISFADLSKYMEQTTEELKSINSKEDSEAFRQKKKHITLIKKILIKKWAEFRPAKLQSKLPFSPFI
jgi:hypothetical protein